MKWLPHKQLRHINEKCPIPFTRMRISSSLLLPVSRDLMLFSLAYFLCFCPAGFAPPQYSHVKERTGPDIDVSDLIGSSELDPSPLVMGVTSICAIGVPGPLCPLSPTVIPIVAGDDDTTPLPSVVVMASQPGGGRVVAFGHDGFLTNDALGLFDNKRFGNNVVDWLDKSSTKRILVTTSHREWYGGANFDSFKQELESRGYTVTKFSGAITTVSLSGIGVVLIGDAWGEITQQEIDLLRSFVSSGGGLFLMGLGWSWEPYNPGSTLDDFPMNKLGEHFGIRWISGYISDPTNNYNNQPVFHTFYPNIELQTQYQAFSYINATTEAHPQDLPSLLQYDALAREKYVGAHLILATETVELSASSGQRQEIYDFYKDLISSSPQYFRRSVVYDKTSQSVMAWIRERIYRSFMNAILYGNGLTSERKAEIATSLGLTGSYYDIWNDFSVLLLDNAGLNERQRTFTHSFLGLVPIELHNLHSISVIDNLGQLPHSTPGITLWGKDDGVNIFGSDIGAWKENGFPDDVPAKYSDVFCLVVVHEVNHIVDAFCVSRDAALRNRKADLIGMAGSNHLNYLRSMLPDGFFVSAPQEFFASISNQWFSDSALTLRLALTRFDQGYRDPLNQFLFFAEVYSRGGGNTLFYSLDILGNLQRREVTVLRDGNGRINAIIDGTKKYVFTLDQGGNIVSYSVREVVFHTISVDSRPRVAGVKVDGVQYTQDQAPTSFEWEEGSTHTLEVPTTVQLQPGVRYVFERWNDSVSSARRTATVSTPVTLAALYRTEYLLSILSPYGTPSGGGWHTRGEAASLSVQSAVDHGNGTRRVLRGWYRDGLLLSSAGTLSMEILEPTSLEVRWETEYLVNATTPVGDVSGAAWYRATTNATVSVSTTQLEKDFFTNYVFEGWKKDGATVSTLATYSFTVSAPANLVASWKTELNLVTVGGVAAGALLIIGIAAVLLRKPKAEEGTRVYRTEEAHR